jgi:hypothetical protein
VSDVRGFYDRLGIVFPARQATNVKVRCFMAPERHRRQDRDPSCSVSTTDGAFNCFVCGAKGGPYNAAIACGLTPAAAKRLLEEHGLFREQPRSRPRAGSSKTQSAIAATVIARFVYRDESGRPLTRRAGTSRDGMARRRSSRFGELTVTAAGGRDWTALAGCPTGCLNYLKPPRLGR